MDFYKHTHFEKRLENMNKVKILAINNKSNTDVINELVFYDHNEIYLFIDKITSQSI